VRWGTYARKTPDGIRIPRWYCRRARETFSLLPDCLASRFPGELADLERVVAHVETARSTEAAADVLRPEIELPSAVRWVRRRLTLVRATLVAVVTLLPEVCGHDARLGAVRAALETDQALVTLRLRAAALLPSLSRPLGFAPPVRRRAAHRPRSQHDLGPDARAPPAHDPARPPERARRNSMADTRQLPLPVTSQEETVALFRYGLIADLLHLPPGDRTLHRRLREKADREYDIPGSARRRVAAETLRDWLYAYRRGGFDALKPRPRGDTGQTRALPQAVADQLCALKEAHPTFSVAMLIATARQQQRVPPEIVLAPATVHRLLSRHGLMARRGEAPTTKDRRRFAFDAPNELWMSDVMHGPSVTDPDDRRRHKTYLIALLDDATRIIPAAAFARSETVAAFLPVLERAIRRRGLPKRLYVDNGAAYRSRHLALVCAKLGVTLIHARPFSPQAKGKQERWFRTARTQLLPTLTDADTKNLEALNRRLWAWIEDEYHYAPHRGLDGATPIDRWAAGSAHIQLTTSDLSDVFLFEEKRKVQQDRTVSLHGVVYEVDAALVGQTVTLRYDPARARRGVQVVVSGRATELAKPVDAYANCFVRRDHATKHLTPDRPASQPAPGLPLRKLDDEDF